MTLTQKILARGAGLKSVEAGQFIEANVDFAMGNDVTGPVAISVFEEMNVKTVFDNTKIALVPDHFTPNKDIQSAEQCKIMRDFAAKHNILNYFELGRGGVAHCLLPENGLIAPGQIVIGADSHTCTYGALNLFSAGVGSTDLAYIMATGKVWLKVPPALRFNVTGALNEYVSGKDVILYILGKISCSGALYMSMEYFGAGIANLSVDDRLTIANMAVEAGAKNAVFPYDEKTREYLALHGQSPDCAKPLEADSGAVYEAVYDINLSEIPPLVAAPHSPDNVKTAKELRGVKLDQVVIGSCTNGRLSDFRVAASILKGKKIAKNIRLLIIPATQEIYQNALSEGLLEIFAETGAAVCTPTCGPCLGGHMGVLASGETSLSTTNRNFVGRMGHKDSGVYLANPAVAAASAIAGEITSPLHTCRY